MSSADRSMVRAVRWAAVISAVTVGAVLVVLLVYVAYVYGSLRDTGAYPVPPIPNPLSLLEAVLGWVGVEVSLPDIPTSLQFTTGEPRAAGAWTLAVRPNATAEQQAHLSAWLPGPR